MMLAAVAVQGIDLVRTNESESASFREQDKAVTILRVS